MAKKGTLTVRVVSDTKNAEQGLDRFATKAQTTGQKLEGAGRKMTMFATVPVAAAMGVATKAASDLQQAVGGTEAVFGDAADAINDYAKTAARASGLSEREFREATTSIGGQLKRMTGDVDLAAEQSMELTKVAADLAATYGGTTADAVAALGSAFRGEADPAERFNLNLKISAVNAKAVELGLAASTNEVDDNAKAQATLALITEQSADAQGQFAREAGSAAGSMQIAKAEMENAAAELGTALLPIVSKAAGGVADLAVAFGDLPDPIQNTVIGLGLALGAMGPLMTVGGRAVSVLGKVGPAFDKVSTGAYAATGHLGKFGAAAGALALTAVVFELSSMAKELTTVNTEVERLNGLADDELADTLERMLTRAFTGNAGNQTKIVANFTDEIERIARESPAAAESLLRLAETADGDLADAMDRAGVTTDDMAAAMDRGVGAAKRSTEAQGRNAEIVDDTIKPTEDLTEAVADAADEQDRLADSIKGVDDALRASLDPLFAAQDALNDHKDAQDDLKVANLEYLAASEDVDKAVEEHGKKSDEAAAAWVRQVEALRRVEDADQKVVRSAQDVSSATAELTAKMEAGEVKIEDAEAQLRAWVDQGIITADQAWRTAEQLRGTASAADEIDGRDVAMSVSLQGFAETIAQLDEISRRTGENLLLNASLAARDRVTQPVVNVTNNYPAPEPTSESLPRILRKVQYGGLMGTG